ncbi:hypothetical protein [Streptomyces sp. H27-D2]|uniref:hypothetical protein n=1 Tax=Streptomyces sp. H27-D2 TaxID=3046304 RepID=UPI002DBCA011|nr:hypothetical protein [Streptomyces sp. H27-D2]MEC4018872.1 hypothetical protein [Streptomyces sp. H27-D2]
MTRSRTSLSGWWARYGGLLMLALVALSWLPAVPAWARVAVALASFLACLHINALRRRPADGRDGGAR